LHAEDDSLASLKTRIKNSNADEAIDCPAGLLAQAEAIFANPDAVLNAELAVA